MIALTLAAAGSAMRNIITDQGLRVTLCLICAAMISVWVVSILALAAA